MVMKWTKQRKNEWQRNARKKNGNSWTHRYEKTPGGFLMRKYRNMESRVTGVQKQKFHLYKGLAVLPREIFYKWSLSHPIFQNLFGEWVKSDYQRKLCPTVDRIDPSGGYILENMEWVTHSENSRRGAIHRAQLRKLKI